MENGHNTTGCLPRLRSVYKALTRAEQKAADYILANPGLVVHNSITELAELSGSAEASIFRLCQKIGFKGYQHLKIALAGELWQPNDPGCRDIGPDDPMAVITRKLFNNISQGLQDTLQIIDPQSLEQAVDALDNARRIDAYGSGGSAVIAADIEHRFLRFGIPVRAYGDPHMQLSAAALLEAGDAVIAVSHSGANRDLLESLTVARQNGAIVIAITSHMKSPLTSLAQITLCGMAREANYQFEAMASRLVHLAIVDALYTGVILRNPQRFAQNMQKIRQAIAAKRL